MSSELIVSKYGGSSSICPEDIELKRRIAETDSRRKIIVVSAHGKRSGEDLKDTDLLIQLAKTNAPLIKNKLLEKARYIYHGLPGRSFVVVEDELERRMKTTGSGREDAIKSWGEYACAKLTAEALGYEFVDPRELFIFDGNFGNAIILDRSRDLIRNRLGKIEKICVIPGFYGYKEDGSITTLSRGGSDLTGAYLAAVLGAEEYENFTDSPVLTTDPKLLDNKRPAVIREVTYKELRDLSYSGFGIFHQEAVFPVKEAKIPVHVRSTRNFPEIGTYVTEDRINSLTKPIVGIAFKPGYCSIDIQKDGLNEQEKVGKSLLDILSNNNLSYELTLGAIDDISIILSQNQFRNSLQINKVMKEFYESIGRGTEVTLRNNLGIIAIAGKGIRDSRDIGSRVYRALEEAGIREQFSSEGSTKRCRIIGVDQVDGPRAIQALFGEFPYLFAA